MVELTVMCTDIWHGRKAVSDTLSTSCGTSLVTLNTCVCHLLPRVIQWTALTWADITRNASHSLPLVFSQGQPVTDLKIKLLSGL